MYNTVADPDLQEGGGEGSSRPWDKEGAGSQKEIIFGPSGLILV